MKLIEVLWLSGVNDIIQLTYAYSINETKDRFFNRTLFSDFSGASNTSSPEELLEKFHSKYEVIVGKLGSIDYVGSAIEIGIKKWYVEYIRKILELTALWVHFEIQKRHPQYCVQNEKEILQRIKYIDAELFGRRVADDVFEYSRSIKKIVTQYQKWLLCTSREDCEKIENCIDDLKHSRKFNQEIFDDEIEFDHQLKELLNDLLIPREQYIPLFESVLALYGIDIPVYIDQRSSVYDGVDGLYIPDSKSYENVSAARILELIAHEIETHYIVQYNTKILLWDAKVQWAWNLEREEGLAMMMEHLLRHDHVDDFDITSSVQTILMWEVYEWKKFLSLLESYYAQEESDSKAIELFLRRKRNYPLWLPWVLHKDISYSRWKFKVRNRIQAWKPFDTLFLAKVNFEDIEKFDPESDHAFIFPQFIAKSILKELEKIDLNCITREKFISLVNEVVQKK